MLRNASWSVWIIIIPTHLLQLKEVHNSAIKDCIIYAVNFTNSWQCSKLKKLQVVPVSKAGQLINDWLPIRKPPTIYAVLRCNHMALELGIP